MSDEVRPSQHNPSDKSAPDADRLTKLFPSELSIDGKPAPLRLVCGSPRRRRLAIRITREATIELLLPPAVSERDIRRALNNREGWIAAHIRAMRLLPPASPLEYDENASHWYLGQAYTLHIQDATQASPGYRSTRVCVEPEKGRLTLRLASPTKESIRTALEQWFRLEARRVIGERLAVLCAAIPWIEQVPEWRLQTMRRRWGSCSCEGRLTFNTRLIRAPLECLDYVLFHEIAHLREMNHSKNFYFVLSEICPNWVELRKKLESGAHLYLAL